MKLYTLQIATGFFIVNSIFFSGCSTNNYSLERSARRISKVLVPDSENTMRVSHTNYRIFSNNRELNYIAGNEIYKINNGDKLDISVFKVPELSKKTTVNSRGNISFPLIGKFHIQGLSQEEAENKLAAMLRVKYLRNPQVSISINNKANNSVTLEGWVRNPGVFPLDSHITLLQSIALAGGLNDMADPTKVILFRKSTSKTYLLNLQDIRDGKAGDPYIKADDRIVVARSGTRSFIKDASVILGGLVTPLWGLF